jgi:hypothetical protein
VFVGVVGSGVGVGVVGLGFGFGVAVGSGLGLGFGSGFGFAVETGFDRGVFFAGATETGREVSCADPEASAVAALSATPRSTFVRAVPRV